MMDDRNLLNPTQNMVSIKRLVVCVPDHEFDEIALGRRVWNLALPHHKDVLLLSAVQNPDEELRAIHRLTQMAAVVNDPRFHLETSVRFHTGWVQAIKAIYSAGDLVVCFDNHLITDRVFWRRPIYLVLERRLHLPFNSYSLFDEPVSGAYGTRNVAQGNR